MDSTHSAVQESEDTLFLSNLQQLNASLLIRSESHDVTHELANEHIVLVLELRSIVRQVKRQLRSDLHPCDRWGELGGISWP